MGKGGGKGCRQGWGEDRGDIKVQCREAQRRQGEVERAGVVLGSNALRQRQRCGVQFEVNRQVDAAQSDAINRQHQ